MVAGRSLAAVLFVAAVAAADVAVPETGAVFQGKVDVAAEKGEALLGGAPRPLREILLVERDDGTLVWCGSFERRLAGYRRMVFEGRRSRIVEMIKEATKAKDPELARRLLELARAEGFSGKEEDVQRRRVENLEKKPGKRDDAKSAELRKAAAALEDELPGLLLARAKGDKGGDALRLLREAIRAKPEHNPSLVMLGDLVPKPQPFPDSRMWLDWAVEFERRGFKLLPDDHVELKKARHYWRPDLLGIASDEVLVLTPVKELEPLREIVLRADLACKQLREMFRTDKPAERTKGPILIYLETNEQNFREQVDRKTNPLPPYFRFKHAHWDREDDITRILWRAENAERNDLLYGSVHEVVRHWLYSRNPRYSLADLNAANSDVAGYWAEVGLSALFAEAHFDLEAGRIDLGTVAPNSRAFVRDHARDVLPWGPFFLFGRSDIHALNEDDVKRAGVWASYLFARQATNLCDYLLFADGGKRKAAFVEFYVNRRRGDQPKLAPSVAFGMSADELGAASVAWAAK